MSQCTSIKADMAFTGNMFNKSHPRHTFTDFIKMFTESEKNISHEIKKQKLFHSYPIVADYFKYQLFSLHKWFL